MPHSRSRRSQRRASPSAITAVLALSGTLVALLATLVVPLLPDFPAILGVTVDDATWLVTATLLSGAVATPIVSKSADMFGKRKMMIICLAVMVAGSVVAAAGGSFVWLLVGRTLQGFSGALIPIGMSIMRDELPTEQLGTAVALMSATLGIGGALGLPLAGALYDTLGWASIFWLSAGAGFLLLLAIVLVVPASEVRTPGRFDVIGALVLSMALVALLLAISKGGSWGWGSERIILLFLAAALLLALWIPYELRVHRPIVDLRTSTRRPVLMTNLASLLIGLANFANMLLTTQQLQLPAATGYGLELSAGVAGLCMLPSGLAMVVFAPLSGRIIRNFGGKVALLAGASVMTVGYIGRVFLYDSVTSVIIGSTAISIGTAIAYTAAPSLIMGAVPVTETASANGLNTLIRNIGSAISSAVIATVLASVTITVGSTLLPSVDAFKTLFWMASLASAASALTAVFIPRRTLPLPPVPGISTTLYGRVLTAGEQPAAAAVVTVLRTTGEQVGRGQGDSEGNYRIELPHTGEYLVIAFVAGWKPVAESIVLEAQVSQREINIDTGRIVETVGEAEGVLTGGHGHAVHGGQ